MMIVNLPSRLSKVYAQVFTVLAFCFLIESAACDQQQKPRCAECGMHIDDTSSWIAGAQDKNNQLLLFDTPRCLFFHSHKKNLYQLWFREYYSHARRSPEQLVFIMNSNIIGPMGHDLIPVSPDHKEQFLHDHQGRVLNHQNITKELLKQLSI